MKLRGLLAAGVFIVLFTATSQADNTTEEYLRLKKACPESLGDEMLQVTAAMKGFTNAKLTGDPRADGKLLCERITVAVQALEKRAKILKSCQPTTEPFIEESIKTGNKMQMLFVSRMSSLGCKY